MGIEMICHCGSHYVARPADLKRGWARSCSKECAAIRREFGRPAAKRVDGEKIKTSKSKVKKVIKRNSNLRFYSSLERDERFRKEHGYYPYEPHPMSGEAIQGD